MGHVGRPLSSSLSASSLTSSVSRHSTSESGCDGGAAKLRAVWLPGSQMHHLYMSNYLLRLAQKTLAKMRVL